MHDHHTHHSCSCGCDHHEDHHHAHTEHHHEHDHSHGHEHHHDHSQEHPAIQFFSHDHANIATVQFTAQEEYDSWLPKLQSVMHEIAFDIESQGGFIGHIKAFVHENCRNCMISVTSPQDLQTKAGNRASVRVELAVIVFDISHAQITEILKIHLAPWL